MTIPSSQPSCPKAQVLTWEPPTVLDWDIKAETKAGGIFHNSAPDIWTYS